MRILSLLLTASALLASAASAAEQRVRSPDGKLTLVISDDAGLRYRVELEGKPLLANSVLGLAFADGTTLGPAAKIADTKTATRKVTWETTRDLGKARALTLRLAPGGGYAAILSKK